MTQMIDTGPTSHHFMSQRLRLHYLDWGNPDAPTLVLQHGGRDHARSWDDVARALRGDWHVVCPDLRGHGDSDWSPDGAYLPPYYSYDMAQFIHQLGGGPVSMIAHSLGGNIAIRHAALFPETIAKLVLVEGLVSPLAASEQDDPPGFARRWREWIENRRGSAGRSPRRYPSIESALARMIEANPHLTQAQARHLTIHGMIRNEDGTLSWKFDDYMRHWGPMEVGEAEQQALWAAIECPLLMVYGRDSWATSPETDGRIRHFRDARVTLFDDAGHWPHHDRFDAFVAEVRAFL